MRYFAVAFPQPQFLKFRLYGQELARSRFVSVREVDLALQLPDPYRHIDRLVSTRRFFDRTVKQGEPVFRFRPLYRAGWRRRFAQGVVLVAYFAFLAGLPAIAVAFYGWYVPDVVPAEEFSRITGDHVVLLGFSLLLYGYLAFGCILWLGRMYRAESLVAAERDFIAANRASAG